jgi:hypothetical protein
MPIRFQHQEVRELAWLIASAPLFLEQNALNEQGCSQEFSEIIDWLSALDHNPEPLFAHLNQIKSNRLGYRFEGLLAFWIISRTDHEIVKQNWQLIHNKTTIGEIDLLIRAKNKIEHWEAAMKFYLAYNGKWYGPNSIDRLDIKSDLLFNKQLKLSQNPITQSLLSDAAINISKSKVWAKGILFNHAKNLHHADTPTNTNPNCIVGKWCYLKELAEFIKIGTWHLVEHNAWMDPNPAGNNIDSGSLIETLSRELEEKESVMLFQQLEPESIKWFVVNKDWPKHIK